MTSIAQPTITAIATNHLCVGFSCFGWFAVVASAACIASGVSYSNVVPDVNFGSSARLELSAVTFSEWEKNSTADPGRIISIISGWSSSVMSCSLLGGIRAAGLKAYEKQGHPRTTLNSVTCERTCRCGDPIAGITEGAESCESYGTFEPCKA